MPATKLFPKGVVGTQSTKLYLDETDPFSFGLRPDQDHLLLGPHPEDELVAETMNVWIHDGERDTGFNLYAMMQNGEMLGMVTIFLPDGRILRNTYDEKQPIIDPARPRSKHMQYECIQPFRRWKYDVQQMPVWVTSEEELGNGIVTDVTPTTNYSLTAEAITISPAWIQGSLLPEAYDAVAKTDAGLWIAARTRSGMSTEAFRMEQTMMAEGAIKIEDKIYPFKGYGLRGHVRGTRILGGMNGHTWINAATASGTAFAISIMARPDGGFFFSEGFVFKDGILYPSRVRSAPPMSFDLNEGDYVIELVNDQLGLTRIVGRDTRMSWWSMGAWGDSHPPRWGVAPDAKLLLRHGLASFEIDGEPAFGINERSGFRS